MRGAAWAALTSTAAFLSAWVFVQSGTTAAGVRGTSLPSSTLVVGVLSDPGSLNPLVVSSSQVQDMVERMFLKLLEEEDDFVHFRPRLAASWSFSPDSLEVTFELRRDVRWHDGVPCTAWDVLFTYECQVDTVVSWRGRHLKDRIGSVEVVDSFTVRFRFTSRYPNQLMDANDGVILPRHILAGIPREEIRTCDFGRRPVGNGPFRFVRWEPKQYLELERNPDYYERGLPAVKRLVYRIVPDMVTLETQLRTGEIDCLESILPMDARVLEKSNPEIRVYAYPSRSMTFVSWNLKKELFADRKVRRALAMAVDRKRIIDTVWMGMARECKSPMHPILWAYDDSIHPVPYDPSGAREMLEEEGWRDLDGDGVLEKNGKPFRFELITNYGNSQRRDILTMVKAELEAIGVDVRGRVMEWNTFVDRVVGGSYDACVMGWKVGTRVDLKEFWHSSAVGRGGFNISGYADPSVDELIEQARASTDMDRARKLWSLIQRKIYYDQPFLFIAVPYEVTGLHGRFVDVHPSPASFFKGLRYWKISAH